MGRTRAFRRCRDRRAKAKAVGKLRSWFGGRHGAARVTTDRLVGKVAAAATFLGGGVGLPTRRTTLRADLTRREQFAEAALIA